MSKGDSGIAMPMCGPWCPMVTWEGRDPHLTHMCLCFRVLITCDTDCMWHCWSHVTLLCADHMWHCWSHVTLHTLVFFVCWSLCMLTWLHSGWQLQIYPHIFMHRCFCFISHFFLHTCFCFCCICRRFLRRRQCNTTICSRHCRKRVKNEERISFTCSSSEGGVPTGALRRKHTTSPNNTSLDALVCTNTSQGLTANTGTLQIQIQAQIQILQSNLRLTIPVPSAWHDADKDKYK